jgi:CheY-like chemotaxis protein
LGGALGLSSEIGKGTVATLWLPVAVASAEATESTVPQQSGSRNFKVLIVDDDALVAMSTIEMLEDLGHTVTAAHSAKRALELLESGQDVDVLVTDHAMPGMTGIELAGIVQERRPELPILLVTGYADLPAGKVCQWPRLSKPYQQSQLQSAIEALFLERGDRACQP